MATWFIGASPSDIDRLRDDPAFAEVLTLGRVANLLRATMAGGIESGPRAGTAAERQRTAMFLLLTGLLSEALPLLERTGQYFRGLHAHQEHVRPILSDPTIIALRKSFLTPLRNQAVFHNDAEVSRRGLSLIYSPIAQDLARGTTTALMDTYHPFADLIALSYILDVGGGADNPAAWLASHVQVCLQLGGRIVIAIDALVGEALAERGLQVEERDDLTG